jgi:sugar lactone lactonase YvrE
MDDLIRSKNSDQGKLFRPSDVAVGTDGAIYVSDWYDPVVGGHDIKDKKGMGRILRIAPREITRIGRRSTAHWRRSKARP